MKELATSTDEILDRRVRGIVAGRLADTVSVEAVDEMIADILEVAHSRIGMYRDIAESFQDAARRMNPEAARDDDARVREQRSQLRELNAARRRRGIRLTPHLPAS